MSENLDKIKDRVAKLLRMADDSSSPEEAAIAAGRARSLMDKHQLSEYDVTERIAEVFGSFPATRYFAAIPQYMQFLAVAVAKYNDCQGRFEIGIVDFKKKAHEAKKDGRRLMFHGFESDAQLAQQMYVRLLDAIDRLCKVYLTGKGYAKYPVRIGGQFKLGAVLAITSRLEVMTKERDALKYADGTALVVVKKAAVDEHFGDVEYNKVKTRDLVSQDEMAARYHGVIQGRQVEIVPVVDGKPVVGWKCEQDGETVYEHGEDKPNENFEWTPIYKGDEDEQRLPINQSAASRDA